MKLPLSWLKEFVDVDCDVSVLESKLFSCGFEVEETKKIGEKINRIVTCKIIKIEKHPEADKLYVCQIDAGAHGQLQIVTSATNIKEGDIVPVALDNSTLANGEKIKTGKLRGVTSYGMFCSGEELGINDDWYEGASVNGILILKEEYPLGEEVKDLLEIGDVVFDINVTANRSDCQSILGLAREVAVVLNKPLKMPDLNYNVDKDVSTKNTIKVTNNAFDLCQRYKARFVKDIKIKPSPLWLKRRLSLMGLRSINNIVDITNYVLLEIGQPMHAFDLSDLNGKEINVRRAKDNEKIITLDEKEFSLNTNNLVICDAVKPVALAGVMGGLNSEIKETTKNIVFECAKFSRDNVRKTSKSLGQKSDSSSRYEKGVDYYSVEIGLNRALNLIDKLNAGKISCDEYDLLDKPIENRVIKTTISRINGVLGINIDKNYIKNILEKLYFKVNLSNDDIEVIVPLFREDVENYQDLAEEVIREYGYDSLDSTLLNNCLITSGGKTYEQQKIDDLKDLFVSMNFNESITYSFVNEKDFDLFRLNTCDKDRIIRILNPISEEIAVMRQSIMPSLIKSCVYNFNRKNLEGRLFEIAKVYKSNDKSIDILPEETLSVAFALFGDEDFFSAKGVLEEILAKFCYNKKVEYKISKNTIYHPTRCADVYVNNEYIGSIGQINPEIIDELGADKSVYAGELDFNALLNNFNDKIVFEQISKFPFVERDLAVLVDKSVSWGEIENTVKAYGGRYLKSINLFDIYTGNQVEEGKKSVAFNMIFSSLENTLSLEEIDNAIKKILKGLSEKLGAILR